MEDIREESVETKIDNYIVEKCNTKLEEVKIMTIHSKMSLINMKSQDKWDEFKLGLRKAGYII